MYIHYHMKISSKKLVEILPISKMQEYYYVGHEMYNRVYLDKIKPYILPNLNFRIVILPHISHQIDIRFIFCSLPKLVEIFKNISIIKIDII